MLVQQSRAAASISETPESLRVDQFIKYVDNQMKDARRATRLKKMDDSLRKVMRDAAKRLERVDEALNGLYKREGQPDFALEAPLRAGKGSGAQASSERRPS